jgi:hypothetical protein
MSNTNRKKNFYLILILGMLTAIGHFPLICTYQRFLILQKPAYYSCTGNTFAIQFFYWYFCRAIIIWSITGTLWQKKTFIHWTLHLSFSFYWLCPGSIGKCIDSSPAFAGIRWLCGYGSSKSNGA